MQLDNSCIQQLLSSTINILILRGYFKRNISCQNRLRIKHHYMIKSPTYEDCLTLFSETGMLDNIREHSELVAKIAVAIAENLRDDCKVDVNAVRAGALLHDITKTRAITSGEHHDITGGEFVRRLGYDEIAEIVAEHVQLSSFDPEGPLLEKEIVHYADKRVTHSTIVSLKSRIEDLMVRYGKSDEHRAHIKSKLPFNEMLEEKIRRSMVRGIEDVIAEIV